MDVNLMNSANTHYTRTAQILHWLMAIIFIAAWLIGFYSGNFLSYDADGSFKGNVITLHKNIATTIIFLVVIRIFWRYTHPAPKLPDSMSPFMQKMAHLGHLALYFILLALPITGCLFIWISWAAGLLLVGHIAAALKHHFIDKDNVLNSMTKQAK